MGDEKGFQLLLCAATAAVFLRHTLATPARFCSAQGWICLPVSVFVSGGVRGGNDLRFAVCTDCCSLSLGWLLGTSMKKIRDSSHRILVMFHLALGGDHLLLGSGDERKPSCVGGFMFFLKIILGTRGKMLNDQYFQ